MPLEGGTARVPPRGPTRQELPGVVTVELGAHPTPWEIHTRDPSRLHQTGGSRLGAWRAL